MPLLWYVFVFCRLFTLCLLTRARRKSNAMSVTCLAIAGGFSCSSVSIRRLMVQSAPMGIYLWKGSLVSRSAFEVVRRFAYSIAVVVRYLYNERPTTSLVQHIQCKNLLGVSHLPSWKWSVADCTALQWSIRVLCPVTRHTHYYYCSCCCCCSVFTDC